MTQSNFASGDINWKCQKCGCDLIVGPVNLKYLNSELKAELPKCPLCGRVLITEELALGKMAEVEQILEDK
jgi:predicted RNA-binding Zn-ribbon protein involved in translation (DUF1610 family)